MGSTVKIIVTKTDGTKVEVKTGNMLASGNLSCKMPDGSRLVLKKSEWADMTVSA